MAQPTGRPYKYSDDDLPLFQQTISYYFKTCDQHQITDKCTEPYSLFGLQEYLGLSTQAMSEYRQRQGFGDAIKKAEERIEQDMVNKAMSGTHNPIFTMFLLKCKYGYVDKQVIDVTEHQNDAEVEQKLKDLLARAGIVANDKG